jgi:transposase
LWEQVHGVLRVQERVRQGRRPTPTAAILDSQSVKTTERGRHGYDGAKKVNGRKRHLLVDSHGLVIKVHLTAADAGDRDGAAELLRRLDRRRFPRLRHGWVDGATAARSWTGHASTGASRSRSCRAPTAGGSGVGYRPA